MEFKQKLLMIDGHALFHRAYHAVPNMTGPGGFPTGAIFGFLSMLFKALTDIEPTHALVTFDVKGPTFRDKLSADYKATRKAPDELMMVQLPKLKEVLTALDIPIYEKAGYEADDLLGIISNKTPKEVLNIIVTGDLDLLQLIDNNTQVYRFKIGFSDIQIFDIDKMVETYGLHPTQWVDYKAIKGDTSDNIPGVPGIGEKGALDLMKAFGSLDDIYAAAEAGSKKIKAGTIKKLLEGKDKAYLSKKLANINRKDNLEFDFKKTLLDDYDATKAKELLHKLGIKALDNRLPKLSLEAEKKVEEKEAQEESKKVNKPNDLIKNADQALIAAYLLDPGRRTYDASDWKDLAKQLKEKGLLKVYQEIEIPLMDVLAKMHKRGIKLDLAWLKKLSVKLNKKINELTKKIYKEAGREFNIASPIQLREVLFDEFKLSADNVRKTGKTKALSTAAEQLEKLRGLHPIIEMIFEYREIAKLKSTYVDPLPELAIDGRLYTSYSQVNSATGRLASSNPNLQNIPIRSDLGNEVRKAFIADPGKVLLSLDYSQIELRIAASLSGDKEMIRIFQSNGDFHTATAAKIFGVKESEVTANQRRDAKTINFSILYGVSAFGLSERSQMGREEASEYIKKYYEAFPGLKKFIDDQIALAHKQTFMTNPLGRIRYFADIHNPNFAARSAAERQAVNMPMQSLAADIMKMAMIEIENKHPDANMILSVHDELVFEVDKNKAEDYAAKIKPIMESGYNLKVPIGVSAKAGDNWAEMSAIG